MKTPAVLVLLLAATAGSGCRKGPAPAASAGPKAPAKYTCSMHPSYVADKPGDCPICGMKLTPVEAPAPGGARKEGAKERKLLYYRHPMNPSVTSPVPRKDEMGMDYAPVYSDEVEAAGGVEGFATVQIDPERRRLIGLRTTTVRKEMFETSIRTVGRVALDETRVAKVQPRFEGFIEKLHANFTGKYVTRGEPLASIYAPDLLATQQELLLAVREATALAAAGLPDAAEAARDRLRLWGVSDRQIDEIVRRGKPQRTLDIVAPISGYVTAKEVVLGARVGPEMALFDIVDLSTVWVLAEVYEYELPRVRVGQSARVTLSYWPDRSWQGRVSYVLPTVDEKTRTVKVRLAVPNPRAELKPEMFADVILDGKPRPALVVPEDAILETGTRRVAFVDLGGGRLRPREVETGGRARGLYEVRKGLAEGEEVATGAAFLVDSESRLKAALAQMTDATGATGGTEPKGAAPPASQDAGAHPGGRP